MTRGILLFASALSLLGSAGVAEAKSIKSNIPQSALTAFCTQAGVGEQSAQFTAADGTVLSGTIHCEAENVATDVADTGTPADDHGGRGTDDTASDDHGGDNSGSDNSGPGNANSDNSGHSGNENHGGGDD